MCLLSSCYQTVSIADKEVFDFRMVNYTDATEGDAYLDMSRVNMGVTLTVGCIQLIYLNKFVSSIRVSISVPLHLVAAVVNDFASFDSNSLKSYKCYKLSLSVLFPASQAFINNFQEAKEALAEVTVQAAEKAASGVKDMAERSTRLALNVHFNAPLIFMPQSSTSTNVIVADLGRLSVRNRFAKQPYKSNVAIPPVVDIMTVKLTDLKMYRSVLTV